MPAPPGTWVDLGGQWPNYVINFADIQLVVHGFQGVVYPPTGWAYQTVAECPLGPDPTGSQSMALGGTAVEFALEPANDLINANDTVLVEVLIGAVDALAVYEVSLEVTGGDTGSLVLESVEIDDANHPDWVFDGVSGSNLMEATDLTGRRLGALKRTGDVTVGGSSYLGTFTYRASSNASGVFDIAVRPGVPSFLMNKDSGEIESSPGSGTQIGVGVECFDAALHCDDGNPCTDDNCVDGVCQNVNDDSNSCEDGNDCTDNVCVSGACQTTNSPRNTACDDGLFCTAIDKCDGLGTCVGFLNPCPFGQACDEIGDRCLPN